MSSHEHGADASVPEIRLGPKAASVERISGVVGGLGLLLCAAGVFQDHQRFFQSYLFAFMYWGGFAFGGLGVLLLNNVVGGKWGVTSRRFFEAQMRTMPLILVFFVVLLFGLKDLYAWTWPAHVAANDYLRHKQAYLNIPFFLIRSAIYFAIMLFTGWRINKWTDLQDKTGDPAIQDKLRRFSAPGPIAVRADDNFCLYRLGDVGRHAVLFHRVWRIDNVRERAGNVRVDDFNHHSHFKRRPLRRPNQRADSSRSGQASLRLHHLLDLPFGIAADHCLAGEFAPGNHLVS